MWSPCSFTLSDGEDFSEVVGRGPSSSGTSTEHCLKCWQIKTEGSFGVIHTVFLHRQFINDIPQCQWQTQSLELHFTLPWILFLALEEGSRCKITGLLESDSFELELRLLSCEMKCCTPLGRRLGALWLSSWGLNLSKAGFVLYAAYTSSLLPSFCLYILSVLSQAPGFRDIVALATREYLETLKEWQKVFVRKNFFTRWHLQWCAWIDYSLA